MNWAKKYLLPLFILSILLHVPCNWCWSKPEYRGITILHTNDIHDHLIPFSYPDPESPRAPQAAMPFIKNIGGLARLATLVHRIESEVRDNAVLVDAGDVLDGTPFGLEYHGEADFATMSAVGYDAMVTGNHEYGQTLDQFNRNLALATFPVVCANVLRKGTNECAFRPYVILQADDVKVAFLGLTTLEIADYKAVKEGFTPIDPFTVARNLVPDLRKKADVVVVLSHLGYENDEKLAKEVPGIDVIVGGHSHTRLEHPKIIRHDERPGAFELGGTIIVQAYQWAGELGRLDLRLRRDGGPFTVMSADGKLLPVTSDLPEDPRTAGVIRRYYAPIARRYGKVLGQATADLVNKPGGGGPVLNLVCDAIRDFTGAQVSIYGVGGIRGDIIKGPITAWDIATILPFKNKLVVMKLTGKRIKEALIRFPVKPGVSGMKYKMEGNRLIEATIDNMPIQDEQVYTVATIDWLLGLYFADVKDFQTLNEECTTAVMRYVEKLKVIKPLDDDRRNVR